MATEDIFGPNVGSLKWKTIWTRSTSVKSVSCPLPEIREQYRAITLGGDNMKFNNIYFFGTISRNIMFRLNEHLKSQKSPTIIQVIKTIKSIYAQRGFIVTLMDIDGEFKHLQEDISLLGIYLNIVSRNERVPEI